MRLFDIFDNDSARGAATTYGWAISWRISSMSLLEDMFKGNVVTGVAVAGAVMFAPTLLPAVGRAVRPIAKAVIKTGMVAYRETLAGVGDVTGDLVAEARAELQDDRHGAGDGQTGPDGDASARRRGAAGKTEPTA
jgi:Protein of unknown function (DUF5132)